MSAWIVPLDDPAAADVALVGGKGAGLHRLVTLGARVPAGFVVTTAAFDAVIDDDLRDHVESPVRDLGPDPAAAPLADLDRAARTARERLVAAVGGSRVDNAVRRAYAAIGGPVAVRSSAATEDSADASFAGEHDSYLGAEGADIVAELVGLCWASLYTARAVAYRRGRAAGAMAVVVQRMVDARAAGVFMTLNPTNGDRSTFVCEAVWGLGEPLVSGEVTPDRFTVNKISGEVLRRDLAHKPTRLGRGGVEDVPDVDRDAPCLTDDELAELLRVGRAVERAAGVPQDGEFAVDAHGVHLLQARPETVWSRRPRSVARGRTALDAVLGTLTAPSITPTTPEGVRDGD